MIEFYPQIKWVHVAAVIASGSLFALRGLAILAGVRWAMLPSLVIYVFIASVARAHHPLGFLARLHT